MANVRTSPYSDAVKEMLRAHDDLKSCSGFYSHKSRVETDVKIEFMNFNLSITYFKRKFYPKEPKT